MRLTSDERHCPGSSDHCSGNALDIGTGADDTLAWTLADTILGDRRTMYIIHDARGRRAYWRGGTWFAASGHDTHLHVSIDSALRDGTHPWLSEGADMTPEEHTLLAETYQRAKNLESVMGAWIQPILTQIRDALARVDPRAANIEAAIARMDPEVLDRLDGLATGGHTIDLDELADRVADKLAVRLKD